MAILPKDIWYSAVMPFTPSTDQEAWLKYIEWSKLSHLKEVVGMDSSLNEPAFLPDFDDPETYNIGITVETFFTYCYRDIEYVIQHASAKSRFNLLAVYLNPTKEVSSLPLAEFEFVGYELLDQNHQTSALTNCGGFDETFLPDDLNVFGLISSHAKATDIQSRLKENNPMEHHADTNVWAIWRHTKIGR